MNGHFAEITVIVEIQARLSNYVAESYKSRAMCPFTSRFVQRFLIMPMHIVDGKDNPRLLSDNQGLLSDFCRLINDGKICRCYTN